MEIEIGGDLTVRVAVERDKRVGGDDDVNVAQQHAHAHREKLVQDLESSIKGDVERPADGVGDDPLVNCMNQQPLLGKRALVGEKRVAASMAIHPRFGRGASRKIPRTLRGLRGWRHLIPC